MLAPKRSTGRKNAVIRHGWAWMAWIGLIGRGSLMGWETRATKRAGKVQTVPESQTKTKFKPTKKSSREAKPRPEFHGPYGRRNQRLPAPTRCGAQASGGE